MPDRINITALATRDIQALARYYLAEAGISVALRFAGQAEHSFLQLAGMPRMGAALPLPSLPFLIRRWHIDGFPRLIILYRDLPDGIEVIRVVDAARNINALFDDTGFSST